MYLTYKKASESQDKQWGYIIEPHELPQRGGTGSRHSPEGPVGNDFVGTFLKSESEPAADEAEIPLQRVTDGWLLSR